MVRVQKRVMLDFINDEITKVSADKQLIKRTNLSLNRFIANKIMDKEKFKDRKSQLKEYQNIIV